MFVTRVSIVTLAYCYVFCLSQWLCQICLWLLLWQCWCKAVLGIGRYISNGTEERVVALQQTAGTAVQAVHNTCSISKPAAAPRALQWTAPPWPLALHYCSWLMLQPTPHRLREKANELWAAQIAFRMYQLTQAISRGVISSARRVFNYSLAATSPLTPGLMFPG